MCRLLGYCARADVSLAEIMGEQGLHEFTLLSEFHGDGWGWPGTTGTRCTSTSRRCGPPARPTYHELAHRRLGDQGLVHLRWATPGLPVEARNTHPFRRGAVVMAHNGAIHPQDRLGELLPPAWERQLTGTTDSERYFLHVMSGLEAGEDMIAAIEATAAHIDRLFSPNSLNAVFLTPDALYAICYYWPERIPHAALATRGLDAGDGPVLRPRLPRDRSGGRRRLIGLAPGWLDAAAQPARPGRRPGDAAGQGDPAEPAHRRPARSRPVTGPGGRFQPVVSG